MELVQLGLFVSHVSKKKWSRLLKFRTILKKDPESGKYNQLSIALRPFEQAI